MLQQVPTRAFHVMAKPSGSDCNLNCDYCFYLENTLSTANILSHIWTMTRWKRMSATISLPVNHKRSCFYLARRRANAAGVGILPPRCGTTGKIWCRQAGK